MEIVDGLRANTSRGTTRRVLSLLTRRPPGRVLDVPAGAGALSQLLRSSGLRVIAVELVTRDFGASGVPLVSADLDHALPFPDESFDCVGSVDGIEHLENPYLAVREFARVLRPGGRLVLSTPNISAFRSRGRYLVTGFHNKGKLPLQEERPSPLHHINLMTFPELRYALHRSGLRLQTVTTNRVKPSALPYLLLYPFVALGTLFAFRREHDRRQRVLNREILRQLLSWSVAGGETLILSATKIG